MIYSGYSLIVKLTYYLAARSSLRSLMLSAKKSYMTDYWRGCHLESKGHVSVFLWSFYHWLWYCWSWQSEPQQNCRNWSFTPNTAPLLTASPNTAASSPNYRLLPVPKAVVLGGSTVFVQIQKSFILAICSVLCLYNNRFGQFLLTGLYQTGYH